MMSVSMGSGTVHSEAPFEKCKNPGVGQEHDWPCQRSNTKGQSMMSFLRSKFTVTKDIFKAKNMFRQRNKMVKTNMHAVLGKVTFKSKALQYCVTP